jgi:hypothetical protein
LSTTATNAGLPSDYTFSNNDNGVHIFSVTLNTLGLQTIQVTDTTNSAILGTTIVDVVQKSGGGGSGGGSGGGGGGGGSGGPRPPARPPSRCRPERSTRGPDEGTSADMSLFSGVSLEDGEARPAHREPGLLAVEQASIPAGSERRRRPPFRNRLLSRLTFLETS